MTKKCLKLKNNEEILVVGNNYGGVLIENKNNVLRITEKSLNVKPSVHIQNLNIEDLKCFVLIHLLESIDISNKSDSSKLINQIMDNYYNVICGKKYETDEIEKIEFQSITYLV